jgi:hypothetical protein
LRDISLQFKTKGQFKKGHRRAYFAATKRDDYDLIVAHMPKYLNRFGVDTPRIEWSEEILSLEALKYGRREDFAEGNWSAYNAAIRRGKEFMDRICVHMAPSLTERYSDLELLQLALPYKSRGEFKEGNPSAYKATHIRGEDFLDKACKGMKPSSGSSIAEKELFELIKTIYPNTKKLRDMKVKIEGKSYIYGFEIDILVGKLGIEFDGKYHHSFEYMRKDKGKKLWSDEDIYNYNPLKDGWFATKGIQILHIKEEDWKKDKQACIQKCLDFLGLPILSTEMSLLSISAA